MVAATDAAALRAANAALVERMHVDLRMFWRTLDLSRPAIARDALVDFVGLLTTTYGDVAASVAAEWYDEMRTLERVPGLFTARPSDPLPVEYAQKGTRFGAGHLWTPQPEQTLAYLLGATQKYMLAPSRDTITENVRRDPRAVGWQRFARADGCKFCQFLAARGAVYKESTADFAAHGDCNCTAGPSWDRNAPEVDARVYVASRRTSRMKPAQLERHRANLRMYLEEFEDD